MRPYGSYPDNPLKVNLLCWISPLKGVTLLAHRQFRSTSSRKCSRGTLRNVRYNDVKLWSTAVEEKRIPVGRPDLKSVSRQRECGFKSPPGTRFTVRLITTS